MVTLKEIATSVGVSTTTVSRVLNFDTTLSVSTPVRKAIIETAEAMNYSTPRNRNRAGQHGLAKVALVHFLGPDQELLDPYYVGLRLGIERRCAALKIETLKLYHSDARPDPAVLRGADGVIAIGWQDESWLIKHSKNIVFADFSPSGDEFDSVVNDLVLATHKLLRALTDIGYRRIAFAGWVDRGDRGPAAKPEKRCQAYMDWMQANGGLDPAICLTGSNTEESGYQLTRMILDQARRPDALITANDNMAVGAYRAINERGLRIPDDIGVASFNDNPVAQFLEPGLSTARLASEEIGEGAVELLVERAAGRELAKRVTFASRLIWRGSTRPNTGQSER